MSSNSRWKIIPTGRVWVDPGGAFGLVPKPLWIEEQPLNENQLLPMDLNSLLIRSDGKNILIDTGIGHKLSEKKNHQWGLEWPQGNLIENLALEGLSPEDIDIVINTHLHSDHCGGNTLEKDQKISAAFPDAEYWVQRMELAEATHTNVRTRNTYLPENYVTLWEKGQLKLLHGNAQVTSEIRCVITPGHSPGHQCVILEINEQPPLLFLADLASFAIHMVRTAWVTAYDVDPIEVIKTKTRWQKWALENQAILVFQHDTRTRLGTLGQNEKGRFEINAISPGSMQ